MSIRQPELRVGLDLRPTEKGFKAHYGRGTGRYTEEVVRSLRSLVAEPRSSVSILECSTKRLGASAFERRVYQSLPYGRHTLEQQLLLPRRIDRLGVDLFHFFAHVDAPSRLQTPYVVTILDLIPLKFAAMYQAGKPNWRFRFARHLELQAIRGASGIFAISEATKRDIVDLLGVAPEKILVTPLAADRRFAPLGEGRSRHALREQFGIPQERPVIMYVGGIDARKNVPFLVDVFSAAYEQSESKPVLVLAGRHEQDDKYPMLRAAIDRSACADSVIELGFVADERLPELYQACDVLAFPSLYEGFGLPVLEAMACGMAVVAGNNSSIPEVVGAAGVLLPDNDHAQWVDELCALADSFERRENLRQLAPARASLFSWERTAELTAEGYRHFSSRPESSVIGRPEEERFVSP